MAKDELTNQQKMFVEAYLANGSNATKAAISAGYSEKTAYSSGNRLLKIPKIQAHIDQRVSDVAMTANEVLAELAAIAREDWKEFLEVRRDKDGEVIDATFRLTDKLKALELVGKHHKLFTDRHELSAPGGQPLFPKDISHTINAIYGNLSDKQPGGEPDGPDGDGGGDAAGPA